MATGPTYEKIATTTLSSVANTVSFSSITGSYTDLIVVASIRMDNASSGNQNTLIRLNDDSDSNYSWTYMLGDGSSASTSRTNNTNSFLVSSVGNDSANRYSSEIWHLNNYSNTTTYKTALLRHSASYGNQVQAWLGLWRSTSAINKILIIGSSSTNFAVGSVFTLYGIAAA